jgi:voltage-gated potassium channel
MSHDAAPSKMSGRLADLTRAERSRAVALAIVKVLGVWVVLFGAYYLAPVRLMGGRQIVLVFIGASVLFVLVVVWQVHRIGKARLPTVQAVGALGLLIPFFLVLFASFYLSLATTSAGNFSQVLDHTGALYFTVTVFATVGFGDIVPLTTLARLVTSVQMLLDLVVLGAVVRIVFFAARRRIEE